MPKFKVEVREVHTAVIEVEADNADDARAKANAQLIEGPELKTEYAWTMEPSRWQVYCG